MDKQQIVSLALFLGQISPSLYVKENIFCCIFVLFLNVRDYLWQRVRVRLYIGVYLNLYTYTFVNLYLYLHVHLLFILICYRLTIYT